MGQLRIKNGARLTIAPGVVIRENAATVAAIVVERGGKIHAVGEECAPIIITTDSGPGTMTRGQCGGIVINGYAQTNVVNSCAGDSASSEGGAVGYYGGNDDNDGSGILRYVRVEYAGKEITPNNELNSFTFNAVGENTHVDFCQAHRGADDGFEWFGGKTRATHLVATDGTDDGLDSQLGSRCRVQFAVVRTSPEQAPSLSQFGERGIEADNNEFGHDQVQCAGRSYMQVANVTFIGDKRAGAAYPGSTQGVELRRGTAVRPAELDRHQLQEPGSARERRRDVGGALRRAAGAAGGVLLADRQRQPADRERQRVHREQQPEPVPQPRGPELHAPGVGSGDGRDLWRRRPPRADAGEGRDGGRTAHAAVGHRPQHSERRVLLPRRRRRGARDRKADAHRLKHAFRQLTRARGRASASGHRPFHARPLRRAIGRVLSGGGCA